MLATNFIIDCLCQCAQSLRAGTPTSRGAPVETAKSNPKRQLVPKCKCDDSPVAAAAGSLAIQLDQHGKFIERRLLQDSWRAGLRLFTLIFVVMYSVHFIPL